MKYILLCGGIGKRCNKYSLPKPLNYINGKHMIEYIISSIPSNEIYIIYNILLDNYNFQEIIINLFKDKKINFSSIDYYTRGAVETALVGINNFNILDNDNLVFIDNDNVHTNLNFPIFNNNFICYGKNYDKTNLSFIKIDDNNNVIDIMEKNKISDNYCCGIYGFVNLSNFVYYANKLINLNLQVKNEFYFSLLYKLMLDEKQIINTVYIDNTSHNGTILEIQNNTIKHTTLRVCFDLDNTLVTFPTIPNDYSTVKPIQKQIDLLNKLKNEGNYIIIYTARRMKTHNHNIGCVIKDIALITINTLIKFNIQYDELIFGKPLADIYIDDKALNPYLTNISYFGIFDDSNDFIQNKVANNKYNKIIKNENIITKNGMSKYLKGELYFYQNIPNEINKYFTKLISSEYLNNNIKLNIEYIDGIPLIYLYKNKLITYKIIDDLFEILQNIHSVNNSIIIDKQNIYNNYFKKLKDRFNETDYFFQDSKDIYNLIINNLKDTYDPQICSVIHGDFWFSNILLEYTGNYKCIDMKGQLDNILTLNGDIYYDYGKLYQSILGYDLVLNNYKMDNIYINKMDEYFLKKCVDNNLNIKYLKSVTASLIFGTLPFINSNDQIKNIWEFLKNR